VLVSEFITPDSFESKTDINRTNARNHNERMNQSETPGKTDVIIRKPLAGL
jgi:hypothetical protein